MYKILIVEGDANFSSTLKIYLEQDNSEVVIVNNFEKVMEYLYLFHPHLVILGAELPIFNGVYWLRRIRKKFNCPIIFISNYINEKVQIQAIEEGADDCLIPPFIYGVIVAKIKRYLYRQYGEYVLNPPERFIKVEELIFYPERLEIHFKTRRITLTYNETIITEVLFTQYPRTVAHKELSSSIQRNEEAVNKNTLYKNIVRVNKKFEILGVGKAIKVVSKIGYRLNIKENI